MTVVVTLLALSADARAHGGEDHGEPAVVIAAPSDGLRSASTASSETELVLRWAPAEAGQPTRVTAFVADFASSAPLDEARVRLVWRGPATVELTPAHEDTGRYGADATFPTAGRYSVTATISGPAGADVLVLDGLEVGPASASEADHDHGAAGAGLPLGLWIVLGLVLVAGLVGLAFAARRQRRATLSTVLTLLIVPPGGGAARLPIEAQFLLGVRTARIAPRALTERLSVPGTIIVPPEARAAAAPPYPGKIRPPDGGAFPRLGDRVTQGQVLAIVAELAPIADRAQIGAQLARAKADQLAAGARLAAARKDLERKTALGPEATERERDEARSTMKVAEADLQAARAMVEALALGGASLEVPVLAPIDGVVAEVAPGLAPGAFVAVEHTLFGIVDLRRAQASARVFETDLARVDLAGSARVDGQREGRLVFASPVVDATTRTVELVYALDAADGALRLNQLATVEVPLAPASDAPAEPVLAVPEGALVELDGRPHVWVKTAAESFVPRPVATGRRDGGFVEVRGALHDGERVVVDGGR